MANFDSLSINDFVEDIFTNSQVKKKRKDIVLFYKAKFITSLFDETEGNNIVISEDEIARKIDSILKADKNSPDPYLSYSSPYYKRARRKGTTINPSTLPDSNYMGKGGECVVMGELLFRGYNVNNMMVDEGIDLVACKNNVFYYIQVKTTNVSQQNKFYFKVKQDRYDAFIGTQMRYLLVARCSFNGGLDRTIFFKFTNDDIERLRFNSVIPMPTEGSNILSIKIEYDERTNKAYVYDGKYRDDITYAMNNFRL
ncbi:MAG: hypothetical protein K2K68_02525 [Duncaniella sp.]|nr:hypothetical protein [Duncaniella sp.]